MSINYLINSSSLSDAQKSVLISVMNKTAFSSGVIRPKKPAASSSTSTTRVQNVMSPPPPLLCNTDPFNNDLLQPMENPFNLQEDEEILPGLLSLMDSSKNYDDYNLPIPSFSADSSSSMERDIQIGAFVETSAHQDLQFTLASDSRVQDELKSSRDELINLRKRVLELESAQEDAASEMERIRFDADMQKEEAMKQLRIQHDSEMEEQVYLARVQKEEAMKQLRAKFQIKMEEQVRSVRMEEQAQARDLLASRENQREDERARLIKFVAELTSKLEESRDGCKEERGVFDDQETREMLLRSWELQMELRMSEKAKGVWKMRAEERLDDLLVAECDKQKAEEELLEIKGEIKKMRKCATSTSAPKKKRKRSSGKSSNSRKSTKQSKKEKEEEESDDSLFPDSLFDEDESAVESSPTNLCYNVNFCGACVGEDVTAKHVYTRCPGFHAVCDSCFKRRQKNKLTKNECPCGGGRHAEDEIEHL